ncbi:MAG: YHS domain-containing protein [Candidatus Daviesbacteria bacterium]|nr:YHS domain-containing protein [Candidatus Daviesbacteria bacterium]
MFGIFNKVTDPVCKMKVDKSKSKFSSEYKDENYYFCSENCKKSFDEEPEKYVAQENIPAKSCCQQNTKSCC